jgi:hypothetical protein
LAGTARTHDGLPGLRDATLKRAQPHDSGGFRQQWRQLQHRLAKPLERRGTPVPDNQRKSLPVILFFEHKPTNDKKVKPAVIYTNEKADSQKGKGSSSKVNVATTS